jgi:hypothetical protein
MDTEEKTKKASTAGRIAATCYGIKAGSSKTTTYHSFLQAQKG